MIMQALVAYYEAKLANEEDAAKRTVPRPNYCFAKVSFAINIAFDGRLISIIPLKEKVERGKKDVELAQSLEVPDSYVRAAGIKANFLCDGCSYLFGIDGKGKPQRALDCFEASKELHLKILSGVEDEAAQAVAAFFNSWDTAVAANLPVIKEYSEGIFGGANMVFIHKGNYIHDNPAVREAWQVYKGATVSQSVRQCLVTGELAPIAILHPKIKGVRAAQSAGANLVGFNAEAYESYGCEGSQGLNAPVSEHAAFEYAAALNSLLSDDKHKQLLGDTTIVYWADEADEEMRDLFQSIAIEPEKNEGLELHSLMEKAAQGTMMDAGSVDFKKNFYILGLSPNAARLSVRFFYRDTFGNIISNIIEHYSLLKIEKASFEREYLSPYCLLKETVSPKSTKKESSPLLSGAVMRSILTGSAYPTALLNAVIIRIRAEHEVTAGKAAIIKAYLNKKNKDNTTEEEITVGLNEESTNTAYVLGRLFAQLEKAQEEANGSSTIRERYFTSACATPGIIFPTLLKLSKHHTAKAEYGNSLEWDIGKLVDRLDDENPYPSRLTLEQQGRFITGYYHQTQFRYLKKGKLTDIKNDINESEDNENV